jgi:NAD(P)-dependent dehydrogenase (short-subunit alcohol dehydrogenase family)
MSLAIPVPCVLQEAYTTATRHELVGTNIRVTSIQPGAALTDVVLVLCYVILNA